MSEAVKVKGQIIKIDEVQTFASGFQKQIIVVKTPGEKYPQEIPIEFVNDKIDRLNDLREGDLVSVSADLRGREYEGRWFLSLNGWNVRNEDDRRTNPARDGDSGGQAGSVV